MVTNTTIVMKGPRLPDQGSEVVEPATITVVANGSGDYTTIQAAVDVAVAGDIIEVRANTVGGTQEFNESVVSQAAGTNGNLIKLRGRSGDTINVTGVSTVGGSSGVVHMVHQWLDWGDDMTAKGQMPWNTNPCQRTIHITASNIIDRFGAEEGKIHTHWVHNNVTNCRVTGGYGYWNGTLDDGETPVSDGGDGCEINSGSSDSMIDHFCGSVGGHAVLATQGADDCLAAYVWVESLWDSVSDWNHPGVTTDGNRVWAISGDQDGWLVDTAVLGPNGIAYDSPQVPTSRFLSGNGIYRRTFVTGNQSGGTCQGIINSGVGRPHNQYYYHCTFAKSDGPGMTFKNNTAGANGSLFGPFQVRNCIFSNLRNNPFSGNFDYEITFEYKSANNEGTEHWTDLLFVDTCAFDANTDLVRIIDQDNGANSFTSTIADMETNFPANFSNNVFGDPNFVDTTTPRVPANTRFADAGFATVQSNWTPQLAGLLNAGKHLTLVNGAVAGDTAVTVDDAGWIATSDVGGGALAGDPIFTYFIEGHGAVEFVSKAGNVLTADQNVTCANNAKIWLGDSSTPNIGWVL
jgi:hypothetical protein